MPMFLVGTYVNSNYSSLFFGYVFVLLDFAIYIKRYICTVYHYLHGIAVRYFSTLRAAQYSFSFVLAIVYGFVRPLVLSSVPLFKFSFWNDFLRSLYFTQRIVRTHQTILVHRRYKIITMILKYYTVILLFAFSFINWKLSFLRLLPHDKIPAFLRLLFGMHIFYK